MLTSVVEAVKLVARQGSITFMVKVVDYEIDGYEVR